MSRRSAQRSSGPKAAPPPPDAPLAAEVLTRPEAFGPAVQRAGVPAWHSWPAVLVSGLLSGLSYALLVRPGLNLAAQATREAGQAAQLAPGLLTHVSNAFGSVFLTALTFGAMWGLGRLAVNAGAPARGGADEPPLPVGQVFGATFTLPILLSVLVLLLILLTPASAWALDPARVTAAQGDALALQRAALVSAARTPAALVLVLGSLLVTAAQCLLAYRALRPLTPRALSAALLPLLPALGLQLLGFSALLVARWSGT